MRDVPYEVRSLRYYDGQSLSGSHLSKPHLGGVAQMLEQQSMMQVGGSSPSTPQGIQHTVLDPLMRVGG